MPTSTLTAIRTKIRRLTRSPSIDQLSAADIDEYVNTFISYDMPEHLRLFTLKTNLTFYTTPFVDKYDTTTLDVDSPLFNFKNVFTSINPPAYIAGFDVFYSQSQDEFFGIYPFITSLTRIATGDGVITFFSGTLARAPFLQNKVLFTSVDANGEAIVLKDVPRISAVFETSIIGDLVTPNSSVSRGSINYSTGLFDLTFPTAPAAAEDIDAQIVPVVVARPQSILYYDNVFTLRPVPDKAYEVNLEAYKRPTELLAAGDIPDLEQWWQYIAYGATKKIFEDRMDHQGVEMIMPEFKTQERLVLRRSIVQQTPERTSTIYSEQTANSFFGGYGPGGNF